MLSLCFVEQKSVLSFDFEFWLSRPDLRSPIAANVCRWWIVVGLTNADKAIHLRVCSIFSFLTHIRMAAYHVMIS